MYLLILLELHVYCNAVDVKFTWPVSEWWPLWPVNDGLILIHPSLWSVNLWCPFLLLPEKKKPKSLITSWLSQATDLKLRTEEFILRNPFPLIMMFLPFWQRHVKSISSVKRLKKNSTITTIFQLNIRFKNNKWNDKNKVQQNNLATFKSQP